MTRSRKTSWLMAAFVLLIGLYPTVALAQHHPAGRWEGTIDVPGMKIEVSVELAHSDGVWSGSIDVLSILDGNRITKLNVICRNRRT